MSNYLVHYGVKGQRAGKRRWTNPDGTLNEAGKLRYWKTSSKKAKPISEEEKLKRKAQAQAAVEKAQRDGINRTRAVKSRIHSRAISTVVDDQRRGRLRTDIYRRDYANKKYQSDGNKRTEYEKRKQTVGKAQADGYLRTEYEKRKQTVGKAQSDGYLRTEASKTISKGKAIVYNILKLLFGKKI